MAVPYIIALILGIVVVGLLGYWFFVLGGQVGGTGTTQQCNAKQASWCQQWSLTGFSGDCPATQLCDKSSNDPAEKPEAKWQAFAPGCGTTPPSAPFCQASFGQGGTGGTGTQPTTPVSCLTNNKPDDTKCTGGKKCDATGKCI